jgi:hypothetical protein
LQQLRAHNKGSSSAHLTQTQPNHRRVLPWTFEQLHSTGLQQKKPTHATVGFSCKLQLLLQAAEALASISGIGEFALTVTVIVSAIMMMGPMCDMFGGAMFNPIHNAAFVCAGRGTISLNLVRMVSSSSSRGVAQHASCTTGQ